MRLATTIMAVLALSAGAASAQYTNLHAAAWGEKSHSQILSSALGGTFAAATSKDFSNGDVYANRIKDSAWYSSNDQVWNAGTYHATIVAREAAYTHTFGYVEGTKNNLGGFTGLLRSDELGSKASVTLDSDFRWAIKVDPQFGGRLYTSREHDNADCDDHMTSYELLRDGKLFGYALFFEDLKRYHSDKDYNDVAVLLTLVPTPQAAMMGLTGLGGLGLLAGRRRRETL